jgi:hypothetical protein
MRRNHLFWGRVVPAALSFFVLALPSGAEARPQHVIDYLCLSHLFAGASKLGKDSIKQLGKCHSQRLNGNLPPETDCNDETNAPWAKLRARDAFSLRRRAYRRCHVPMASPPATMGFTSCPAPCDTTVPAISSYEDVANCITCQVLASSEVLAAQVYGTPPLPAGPQEACFSRLTRVIRHYIGARLKALRNCRLLQAKGRLAPEVDCSTFDGTGIVARALSLVSPGVEMCTDVDLQSLDSCGHSVEDEIGCLPPALDGGAVEIFETVY